jgi:hypothetical protein
MKLSLQQAVEASEVHFLDNRITNGGNVVSLTFLLEA